MDPACILVVDDEESLLESIRFLLEQQGYRVLTALRGAEALAVAAREKPDLVLLDVMLPGMDGFEICRSLRQQGFAGLVVLLTARGDEIDQVVGLELGADDYLTKPFRHRELAARLKAHLRRSQREGVGLSSNAMQAGELRLVVERREAWHGEKRLELSPKEFQLLQYLLELRGRACTREQILEACWGYDFEGESRVVNVTIQRLREKLESAGRSPQIVTVRSLGYMLDV